MSRRDDMLAKAARLRERADDLDRQIEARTVDPMAEHFPLTAGAAHGTRPGTRAARRANASDERTWQMMRDRDRLRSRAASLEATARTTVFSDDSDGLAAEVAKYEKAVADCDALLADPAKVAKYGADSIRELRRGYVTKRRAARKRLDAATGDDQ